MTNRKKLKNASLLDRLFKLSTLVSICALSSLVGDHLDASTLFVSAHAHTHSWKGVAQRLQAERHDYSLIQDPTAVLAGGAKQLSDINILLPLQQCATCRRAHKLVSAINGCYQWKVSHPENIELTQITSDSHPECANVAEVANINHRERTGLAWLTATDQSSGQVLTAQIKVAKIARIEVSAHLRQINTGDKLHLEVVGYDSQGNTMSTLDGFHFDWTVDSGHENIRVIPFKDVDHLRAHGHMHLDEGASGDDMTLHALRPGFTQISVRIREPGYEKVAMASFKLTIVDQFVVQPAADESLETEFVSDVAVLPVSELQLKAMLVKRQDDGRIELRDVKSPANYEWTVAANAKTSGSVESTGLFRSKEKAGDVEVITIDKAFRTNQAGMTIRVVDPYQVRLEIVDVTEAYSQLGNSFIKKGFGKTSFQNQLQVSEWDDQWVLVEQHYYLVKAFVYDENGSRIHVGDNVQFESKIGEGLEAVQVNKIGSESIIYVNQLTNRAKAKKAILRKSLKKIISKVPTMQYRVDSRKLSQEKEVTITGPVGIFHQSDVILLPQVLHQGQNVGEIWHLQAFGGSGAYRWESEDPEIAAVKEQAYLKSNMIGQTVLWVRDHKNLKNFAKIVVEVRAVAALDWLESRIEISNNQKDYAILNSVARDSLGRKFTNCTNLQLEFALSGEGASMDPFESTSWANLQSYLKSDSLRQVITLKDQFDSQKQASFVEDLDQGKKQRSLDAQVHNNFGICNQVKVQSSGTAGGLAKVTARLSPGGHPIESEKAEVVVFDQLAIQAPNYDDYLESYYSRDQDGQEFKSFDVFAPRVAKGKYSQILINAHGSHLKLVLQGGSNYWKKYEKEYATTWSISQTDQKASKNGKEQLVLSVLDQNAQRTELDVYCGAPESNDALGMSQTFEVEIKQQNRVNRDLIRPAQHTEKVLVVCTAPFQHRLLWSQDKDFKKAEFLKKLLPKSRLIDGVRVHFVLTGSTYSLRTMSLDKGGRCLLSQESLNDELAVSDASLAVVKALEGHPRYMQVEFSDKTGRVVLHQKVNGFKQDAFKQQGAGGWWGSSSGLTLNKLPNILQSRQNMRDQLQVEVVRPLQIEPRSKTIYFKGSKNTFSFRIGHGSGSFRVVLNDTTLAEKKLVGRDLKIIPKREGDLTISIYDEDLPDSNPAEAVLTISRIQTLVLQSPVNLIEQDQSINMTVRAYDVNGREFDEDQYERMSFDIQTEMTAMHSISYLEVKPVHSTGRIFSVTGAKKGSYILSAFVKADEEESKIFSKAVKLEVFPNLVLHPSDLLLTPNMRFTLNIEGGPSRDSLGQKKDGSSVSFVLNIKDREIATINAHHEITAHKLGDTELEAQIIHAKSDDEENHQKMIISNRRVRIRVRLVTHVEIPHNRPRVTYSDSILKQIVELKHGKETFSFGIAPISYSWNCSSPNVLKAYFPRDLNSLPQGSKFVHQTVQIRDNLARDDYAQFTTSFNSSSIFAKAIGQGKATLSVKVAIQYPAEFNYEQNWFVTETEVKVHDRLGVAVPEYIDSALKTHLYMVPRNIDAKISTNKNVKLRMGYSMQSVLVNSTNSYEYRQSNEDIIQLIEGVGIRTLDKYGKVTLILEESQQFGDQAAMLNVLITDIYAISANNFYDALSLPLGSTMQIPISFQNEHAHLFAKNLTGVRVGVRLSHPRVVSVTLDEHNETLSLAAGQSGECNVMIFLEDDPHIYDVFMVRVSSLLQPSSPVYLHQGASVTFKLLDDQGRFTDIRHLEPVWSTTNQSVIEIDSKSGIASTHQEGTATVHLSNSMKAQSLVQVRQVDHIELTHGNLMINIDERSQHEQQVRLRLYLSGNQDELLPVYQFEGVKLVHQNVQVYCVSSHPSIFEAYSEISDVEGYFCKMNYRGSSSYKSVPNKVTVTVEVAGRDKDGNEIYRKPLKKFEVLLNSKVHVEKDFQRGVTLDTNQRSKDVMFVSLGDVDVQSSLSTDNLIIKKGSKEANSNQQVLSLHVPTAVVDDFRGTITLKNKQNNELTRLPVQFKKVAAARTSKRTERRVDKSKLAADDAMFDAPVEGPAANGSEERGSWIPFLITIFLLASGASIFSDKSSGSFFQMLGDLFEVVRNFCLNRGRVADASFSRSFHSAVGQPQGVSRYPSHSPKRDFQQFVDQSAVREARYSPDDRARRGATMFQRGTVASPGTLQRDSTQSQGFRRMRGSTEEPDKFY